MCRHIMRKQMLTSKQNTSQWIQEVIQIFDTVQSWLNIYKPDYNIEHWLTDKRARLHSDISSLYMLSITIRVVPFKKYLTEFDAMEELA